MCKPKYVENTVQTITDPIILDFNFDFDDPNIMNDNQETDISDFDDYWSESDPNDYSDEEFIFSGQIHSDVDMQYPQSSSMFINSVEQGDTSDDSNQHNVDAVNNDNNSTSFLYEPLPEIDYLKIDCELIIEDLVDHIEAILDNMHQHLCRYCL